MIIGTDVVRSSYARLVLGLLLRELTIDGPFDLTRLLHQL
jgi:hypothetical protein